MVSNTLAGMRAAENNVIGMASAHGKGRDLLVVTLDEKCNAESATQMIEELRSKGIEAVAIFNVVHAGVANKASTFLSGKACCKQDQRYEVVADGEVFNEPVIWCETSLGLICYMKDLGQFEIERFDKVEFRRLADAATQRDCD